MYNFDDRSSTFEQTETGDLFLPTLRVMKGRENVKVVVYAQEVKMWLKVISTEFPSTGRWYLKKITNGKNISVHA